jgi:hypothetical protein
MEIRSAQIGIHQDGLFAHPGKPEGQENTDRAFAYAPLSTTDSHNLWMRCHNPLLHV